MLQTLVGVVALEKEKKEEPKGLGKRDVGPEGRKRHKMEALPTTEVESQKGKLASGGGRVIRSGYVDLGAY